VPPAPRSAWSLPREDATVGVLLVEPPGVAGGVAAPEGPVLAVEAAEATPVAVAAAAAEKEEVVVGTVAAVPLSGCSRPLFTEELPAGTQAETPTPEVPLVLCGPCPPLVAALSARPPLAELGAVALVLGVTV